MAGEARERMARATRMSERHARGGGRDVRPPAVRTLARPKRISLADGALAAMGCAAAVCCAGFAAYMSVHPHPMFNGVEHLMIFAQPNGETPTIAQADMPAASKGIDYAATGTIRPIPVLKGFLRNPTEPIIRAFALHYIHDGHALIVGHDQAVYRVGIGSPVPGGGRVLAIEKMDGRWVVITSRGLILGQ